MTGHYAPREEFCPLLRTNILIKHLIFGPVCLFLTYLADNSDSYDVTGMLHANPSVFGDRFQKKQLSSVQLVVTVTRINFGAI